MSISTSRLGLALYLTSNLFYSAGSFIADFNETHVLNPRWPPHARFHNGQTMSLGIMLALTSTYLGWRPAATIAEKQQSILLASLVGSFYCAAGLSAILYPGTDWADPEHPAPVHAGQAYMFSVEVVLVWAAYWLETSRLTKGKLA